MKRFIAGLLGAAVLAFTGCGFFNAIEGSGFPTTTTYTATGFSKVEASHAFKVHIVPDTTYSLTVTSDDNLASYVVVTRSGDTVSIGMVDGNTYRPTVLAAEVHMPSLDGLGLSGASEARVDAAFSSAAPLALNLSGASTAEFKGITCGALTMQVSGASNLAMPVLACSSVGAEISGASTVELSGTTGTESITVSGASNAKLQNLNGNQAGVGLSGASRAYVRAAGTITLSASGASTLYYAAGSGVTIQELSGGSQIIRL